MCQEVAVTDVLGHQEQVCAAWQNGSTMLSGRRAGLAAAIANDGEQGDDDQAVRLTR